MSASRAGGCLILALSAPRHSHGSARGRVLASHNWRYIPNNHLTEKGIIDVVVDDFRLPYKPKPTQRLRGTGLYGPESTMLFRFLLWNRLKNYQTQRIVPPITELREDWKYTVGTIWAIWSVILLYVPFKAVHLMKEQSPWLPAKTDGSRRPKQRSPMIWWML